LLGSLALTAPVTVAQDAVLILAPEDFTDALEPLVRFKNASCRPAFLLSLGDVDASFPGDDMPERIKRCIAFYEEYHDVDFVLLVGDVDTFPTRFRWWGLIRYIGGSFEYDQRGWAATDLYYADLYKNGDRAQFDDWDANGNGLYGEIQFSEPTNCNQATYGCTINQDEIDFIPDVSVGRIPASDEDELRVYVNKVVSYEMKTKETASWFKKMGLYTGTWLSNDDAVKNTIGNLFPGFQLIKRYHGTNTATPQQISGDFNGGLGFANYMGHGSPGGWSCVGFDWSHVANLTNADELPVVVAAACDTGRLAWLPLLHPYVDTAGTEHCGLGAGEPIAIEAFPPHASVPRPDPVQDDGNDGLIQCPPAGQACPTGGCVCTNCQFDHPCLAEAFLFGYHPGDPGTSPSMNGAIAYLGARSGGQATSDDIDLYFFEAYQQGHRVLGAMWRYMIEEYYDLHGLADSHTWVRDSSGWPDGHVFDEPQKYILFGDPSLVVGGAFNVLRSGSIWDWDPASNGPMWGPVRYRVDGDVTVPAGLTLTILPWASVLVEDGRRLTGLGSGATEGIYIAGAADSPVYLLSLSAEPQADHVVHGIRARGEIRLRNGGQIRMH
jgi:hypothetical protein